jgi:sulfur carrier protein
MNIRLNGDDKSTDAATIAELLRLIGVAEAARGVAVALNGEVVPRSRWAESGLHPGDDVEVVRPFAGG